MPPSVFCSDARQVALAAFFCRLFSSSHDPTIVTLIPVRPAACALHPCFGTERFLCGCSMTVQFECNLAPKGCVSVTGAIGTRWLVWWCFWHHFFVNVKLAKWCALVAILFGHFFTIDHSFYFLQSVWTIVVTSSIGLRQYAHEYAT